MPPDEPQSASAESLSSSAAASYPAAAAEPMPATPPKEGSDGPASTAPIGTSAPRRLTYLPAFRYVFENPDWFSTIVFSSIIGFLPVLGQISQVGFYYDIVEALYRQPNAPYPKYEFRRFGDYCTRGVWPYVLAIMVGVFVYLVIWLPTQLTLQFGFIFLMRSSQVGALILAIVAPVVIVGDMLIIVAITVLTSPFMLRAGLSQSFQQIFQFDWCRGYLKRVWVEEVLATLFIFVTSVVLISLGCCAFLYGAYAAGAIASIASANIRWQIYEIYLERGGEPIRLHPLPAEAPPVGVEPPRQ